MQLLRCSIMHKSHDQALFEFMIEIAAAADDSATADSAAASADAAASGDAAAMADAAAPAIAASGADAVAAAAALSTPEQQQQQQPLHVLDDPQQVLALLETAVQYSNSAAVHVLAQHLPVVWGLKASALMPLARTVVQTQDKAALIALCGLRGMQQLGGQQLGELLWWAAKFDNSKMVKLLASLPGARQVTGADMSAILHQAAQTEGRAIEALLTLPARSDICWQSAADLLELAAAAGPRSGALKALLELPNAADIDAASQKRLLQFAVANHDDAVLQKLCSPDGFGLGLVPDLQANDVLQLMFAALDAENCPAVMQLCSLTAASELSPEQLQLLISEIVSGRLPDGDDLVCQLLGDLKDVAEQLQSNQVFDLMTEVVEMGCSGETRMLPCGMLETLGELPGATVLQSEQVTQLLKKAVSDTASTAFSMVRELCDMEAAQNVYTHELAPVVHLALTRRSHRAAFYMLSLPCAQALGPEDIGRCFQVLLRQLRGVESPQLAQDIFKHLLRLPLAREIPASELQQLLQMLLQVLGSFKPGQHTVPAAAPWLQPLLGLLPRDVAGAAVIEQLLCYALQHDASSAKQLLLVKAADMLDAAAVQRLLELAISTACRIQQQQRQAASSAAAPAAALHEAVERICDLPGAQQLQPDVLGELLQSALVRRTPEVLKSMAQIEGAAERMEKGVLLGLLKTAMQRMTGRVSVQWL
jgi:hypothetical protein